MLALSPPRGDEQPEDLAMVRPLGEVLQTIGGYGFHIPGAKGFPCSSVRFTAARLDVGLSRPQSSLQSGRCLIRDGGEFRPAFHLHPRHEPIFAALGLEDRGLALLYVEPVLA